MALPKYAAMDINKFPHVPLEAVDGGTVMEKVVSCFGREMETAVKGITETLARDIDTAGNECGTLVEEIVSSFKSDIQGAVKGISEELDSIQHKLQDVSLTVEKVHSLTDDTERSHEKAGESESVVDSISVRSGQEQSLSGSCDKRITDHEVKSGKSMRPVLRSEERDIDKRKWTLVGCLKRRNLTTLVGSKKRDWKFGGCREEG